jgi:hypothetical protein
MVLFVLLSVTRAQGGPSNTAHVHRDPLGVPHITAESEEVAWYAMGYEQARDGLLFLQYACRAARGQLASLRGDPTGVTNDLAVKILGSHLGPHSLSASDLQNLFAPNSPAIQANFYANCVAFAKGANVYREQVKNATGSTQTQEGRMHAWLSSTYWPGQGTASSLAWVYNTPIDPLDIASHGAYTTASWTFLNPWLSLVNSNGHGYTDTDDDMGGTPNAPPSDRVDPELVGDPLDPSSAAHYLEQLRQHATGLCGMASSMSGSNSFAWSHLFCKDPTTQTSYAGLVADPHQAVPFFSPNFMTDFEKAPNHMWFAHVRVTPPGANQPSYDVFGHVPYGAATFQSCHNRSLAMGGTAAGGNWKNHFVLRLKADPITGDPSLPYEYYSHYHDLAGTSDTYQPLTAHTIHIERPLGFPPVPINYWRAGPFGIILPNPTDLYERLLTWTPNSPPLPLPVLHGERVKPTEPPPRWRVDTRAVPAPPKMRYWSKPQHGDNNDLLTSPMVVALRAPMDTAVAGNPAAAGENRHWRLARDFWELSHLTSVLDPLLLANTNGAAYPVSVCFADSAGGMLTTLLGAVPQRGDDPSLHNAGYSSIDKYALYNGSLGPVPARHYQDRMFDWRFGSLTPQSRPAPLLYLQYPTSQNGNPITPTGPFKAFTLQHQTTSAAYPPTAWSGSGPQFRIDGGFFASASNDNVWGYSRRFDSVKWSESAPTGLIPMNNLVTDNWLLRQVLDYGVAYQTALFGFEALVNQQIVVDQFTKIAEHVVTQGASGQPPLTPTELREFVVSPKLYRSPTYVPPQGVASNAGLPAAVRQLHEVAVAANSTHPKSPIARANKEIQFFKDLWAKLHDPASLWHTHAVQGSSVTVDLRRLWIVGDQPGQPSQVFWYADQDHPTANGSLQWLEMPLGFQLIDFLWSESDLGNLLTAGAAASGSTVEVLSPLEQPDFSALVNLLMTWDGQVPTQYANLPASRGACLLEMLRMGYQAKRVFGRKWVRLVDGGVQFSGSTTPIPLVGGQLPSGPGTLNQQSTKWATLEVLALPYFQHTSLFQGGFEPPYDALYDANGLPRATLGAAQINALVEFFLKLGGHYIHPAHNHGTPSRKMARWDLAGRNAGVFLELMPGNYPLTAGMERVTAVRRLLEAANFLRSRPGSSGQIPLFSTVFTARAHSHELTPPGGQLLWQAGGQNPDYVGHGLRSVAWHEDQSHVDYREDRGFQPNFLGMGGSYATMLTMFPKTGAASGPVESYFWCTPGVEAMGIDPARFEQHMDAHASNTLLPSHFHTFLNFPFEVRVYVP